MLSQLRFQVFAWCDDAQYCPIYITGDREGMFIFVRYCMKCKKFRKLIVFVNIVNKVAVFKSFE